MQPTPSDVHVNSALTNVSVAYMQSATNFIATRVFPNIPVAKQSDLYITYDRADFNRDEMRVRAPATESVGSGWTILPENSYYCPRYSFHHDIPDEVRANHDQGYLASDREATAFVTQKGLLKREKLWVQKFFRAGVWGTNITGVASGATGDQTLQWNDAASDPIATVRRYKRRMLESTGYEPNKLVVGRAVYDALLDHPDMVDRIKAGGNNGTPAQTNRATIATLLEIDELLVMNAIENIQPEGRAAQHQFIGGRHALFVYAPPAPGLMTVSGGYTFSWTGLLGAAADGQRIKTFRIDLTSSDRVEIDMSFDQRVVCADVGLFIENAVAADA